MNSGWKKTQSGVTLIELSISIAVTGMLMTTMAVVFRDGVKAYYSQSHRLEMIRQSRLAMDHMIREIHSAKESTMMIGTYSACSPSVEFSMISFKRWNFPSHNTRFYLDIRINSEGNQNGVLIYEYPIVDGGTTVMARTQLTNGVVNLSFSYPSWRNRNRIRVNLGLLRHKYENDMHTYKISEIIEVKNP